MGSVGFFVGDEAMVVGSESQASICLADVVDVLAYLAAGLVHASCHVEGVDFILQLVADDVFDGGGGFVDDVYVVFLELS